MNDTNEREITFKNGENLPCTKNTLNKQLLVYLAENMIFIQISVPYDYVKFFCLTLQWIKENMPEPAEL